MVRNRFTAPFGPMSPPQARAGAADRTRMSSAAPAAAKVRRTLVIERFIVDPSVVAERGVDRPRWWSDSVRAAWCSLVPVRVAPSRHGPDRPNRASLPPCTCAPPPWPLALAATVGVSAVAAAPAAAADFPAADSRLSHVCRDGRRDQPGQGRPPRHRRHHLDRQELPGPRHLGGQDLRQRRDRRERARGPVRRRPPRPRAPVARADPRDPALADRRLRHRTRA